MDIIAAFKLNKNSGLPLYQQIVEHFQAGILRGDLQPGTKLPTEHELSVTLGVSRGTARQAFRDLKRAGLLERRAKLGTFVKAPDTPAKTPAGRVNLVGLLLPRSDDTFSMDILRGVQAACRSRDFHVVSAHSQENPAEERTESDRMRGAGAEGLIVFPVSGERQGEGVAELRRQGYPFVLIDHYFADLETDYVGVNNFGGGYRAVEHLLLLGHTKVVFVHHGETPPTTTSVHERFEGYRSALSDYGREFHKEFVFEARQPTDGAYDRFFQRYSPPVTAFAVNDATAILLIEAARRCGVRVPGDLAVVGFDDLPLSGRVATPLTTVAQPHVELGTSAAHLLVDQIQRRVAGPKRVVLPTELRTRESCGARERLRATVRAGG